ncbi:nucleotide sugar dehydrogenase [Halorussus gelatinilyticus]|uniref:UDP-N-acetyl-D-mannosamine dehydrogenase n=1 Tax=Halorussus gelatinilyticus TaxID=2937524 RepID=A0A8U0IJH0_9EURY|nr:nucleotide sugar dehydrogenase [Halorussus gelatinilyticus]UPW00404.1 nucleotide sugar dehydrogenase [Halorussus gelatinilyticus]
MSLHELTHLYGNDAPTADQREAFLTGRVPVAVYGLGKMGLPLAAVYADTCGNVVGADVDPEVVETVNAGECHVKREPGLPELVGETVERGALEATDDPAAAAADAAVHVVIVPTPITEDHEADLSILKSVAEDVGSGLDPGDLVVVECTVPPRTCEDLLEPLLAEAAGHDEFGLAFCPERTSSGRALEDIRGAYPKVVGGADDEATRVAELVYGEITDNDVLAVSDATTAEAVKVFEGLYRDVNIALANELATLTDELGIDVNEAIATANTQPFCEIHTPGPGVGGHCIPYYPYFVINGFETDSPLLETAREVNDSMPEFTVETLARELDAEGKSPEEATVAVLGLTYRPGVEETRATPAEPIAERLSALGATVLGVDPMLDDAESFDLEKISQDALYDREPDAVVLVTPHSEFDAIEWERFDPLVVVDGRQSLDLAATDHRVYTVGSG